MLFPFVIVTLNAIKSPSEYASQGPMALPQGLYLQGIIDFWNRVDFGQKLLNSTVISGSVAFLAVAVSVLNAYALGIGRIRGRLWILVFFMLANTLPQEALVYPLYYLAKAVHLYDTQLAVIIIFTALQSAFGTFLLSAVFGDLPQGDPRGGRCRRRHPAAAAVAGGGAHQLADTVGAVHVLLHLDLERVLPAADLPRSRTPTRRCPSRWVCSRASARWTSRRPAPRRCWASSRP